MTRFAFAIAALIALGASAAAETTPPHPVLKAEATVTGDLVRVGDLVENAGIIAGEPIFRAPDLGMTGTVPAAAVAEAVRAHALIGLDTAGLSEVKVTRAARMIPAKAVEEELARALSEQYQLGPAKDITINFDRALRAMYVSPAAIGEPRVSRLYYDARGGRFDADIDLPTGTSSHGTLRLGGRAQATAEVVVLAHAIDRGTVLRDADIEIERRPRAEVGRESITDRDRVVGLAARDSLQAGRIVRTTDLMRPEIVQRNEMVTLVYEMPGIMLTVRGKATEGGAQGDVISIVNEQTKRVLQGVVVAPGRVAVSTGTPRLAANLPQVGGETPASTPVR
ncbi:MAG TPA: flagellar basal body P-ring formation chaperone FlgA [Pseudolabrys sp.]|nr:flagellar basal body P-ring formation chaperone FlgA [Pseudolabrys sp.]